MDIYTTEVEMLFSAGKNAGPVEANMTGIRQLEGARDRGGERARKWFSDLCPLSIGYLRASAHTGVKSQVIRLLIGSGTCSGIFE